MSKALELIRIIGNYSMYVHVCAELGIKPISQEEFIKRVKEDIKNG